MLCKKNVEISTNYKYIKKIGKRRRSNQITRFATSARVVRQRQPIGLRRRGENGGPYTDMEVSGAHHLRPPPSLSLLLTPKPNVSLFRLLFTVLLLICVFILNDLCIYFIPPTKMEIHICPCPAVYIFFLAGDFHVMGPLFESFFTMTLSI